MVDRKREVAKTSGSYMCSTGSESIKKKGQSGVEGVKRRGGGGGDRPLISFMASCCGYLSVGKAEATNCGPVVFIVTEGEQRSSERMHQHTHINVETHTHTLHRAHGQAI